MNRRAIDIPSRYANPRIGDPYRFNRYKTLVKDSLFFQTCSISSDTVSNMSKITAATPITGEEIEVSLVDER
jgi:hypothetical protein